MDVEETMLIKMNNEEDTRRYGRQLAETLEAGDVVCLLGDLGTGKTTLTKAIAEGLGVTEEITSPTFNIVNIYRSGRLPLYHFDVYRLDGAEELYATGADEYFGGDGVCVIEWADLIEEAVPDGALVIDIRRGSGETERIYDIDRI